MTWRTSLGVVILCAGARWVFALPYGDPNQPYDRLPGTWETPHVKWATPLSSGRIKALFIVPYMNSREVVELRQRLDLDYTVIMNVSPTSWADGAVGDGGVESAILDGVAVLERLCRERLDLSKRYDVIVIGMVSWEAIPGEVRDLILQHVERGTGLVYVSPHRLKFSKQETDLARDLEDPTSQDPRFDKLFGSGWDAPFAARLQAALPFDVLPLKFVGSPEELKKLSPPDFNWPQRKAPWRPFSVRSNTLGKGRVVVLDYHNKGGSLGCGRSLTPDVISDLSVYDLEHAILAKCVLEAVRGKPAVEAGITIEGPSTSLKSTVCKPSSAAEWAMPPASLLFARSELRNVKVVLRVAGSTGKDVLMLDYVLRDASGRTLDRNSGKAATNREGAASRTVTLPYLPRGNYYVDLRVLDSAGKVVDFACKSLRVEDPVQIANLRTDKKAYQPDDRILGHVEFSGPLDAKWWATARAVDTWGREVWRGAVQLADGRQGGSFEVSVVRPLCRLWDIYVDVRDEHGVVDSTRTWVGLPNWNFDEFLIPLIFSQMPEASPWKGNFYAERVRQFGINAANVSVIYGKTQDYELFERAHLASVTYAEHLGQTGTPGDQSTDKESSGCCMAELGRMARAIADSKGKPADPKVFPYKWDPFGHGAEMLNGRCDIYMEVARFGSPYFWLCGETYLSGEGQGTSMENSCFCPLCTRTFQDWCREEYKGDLKALNEDWGSGFKDWGEVRGILFKEAIRQKQLPRWVAFRYFMRSRIWSQFFIDWTDMMQSVIGYPVRTGTNGHDQYDFSRFRKHMTSGKLYACTSGVNGEYRRCVAEELRNSFSGDESYLIGSVYVFNYGHPLTTAMDNHCLPWKALFGGYRGFDWEAGSCSAASLGGYSCFTPDLSEPMPFLKNIGEQVRILQGGIANLCNTSKPLRSPVAIVWSAPNHYLSRLLPQQANGFTGGWLYNVDVDGGAIGDCLVLMKNLRIRPTFISPEDVVSGQLQKRGFKAVLLPYSKGMGADEAEALRAFVREGGLVIGTNEPGSYSRYGRKLAQGLLADLFPVLDRDHVVRLGKGVAAYLPNAINGYLGRMEKGDYAGSDSVAHLLKEHAKVATPIELLDASGKPRRDTLMPIFVKGSARYVGMLRASTSEGKETEDTVVQLGEKRHVWDVRGGKYLGFVDNFKIKLDLYPKFFALLPANPGAMKLTPEKTRVKQGEILRCTVEVPFKEGADEAIRKLGHVVHIEVLDPAGKELEWYRDNILIEGSRSTVQIPISFSEKPGRYTLKARFPITGGTAAVNVQVE